jgi:hypothetical protein
MVAHFVREQAWWRLDTPGVSAIRAARCVVALLDAAGCISGLPGNHPDLEELDRANCFASGSFDPGPAGTAVVRGWELADEPTGTTQDLLAALAVTVSVDRGVPSPAARRAATASGAIPAAPLPSHPGPIVPEPAFAPDTVVFGSPSRTGRPR